VTKAEASHLLPWESGGEDQVLSILCSPQGQVWLRGTFFQHFYLLSREVECTHIYTLMYIDASIYLFTGNNF
jgi:hypothetical protein